MAEVEWNRLSAPELNQRAKAGAIVLFPVASTEQHGPHLATGVDTFLCGEVCRRAAVRLVEQGQPAVVAPTLWMGLAEHHIAFGGTFTLSVRTYQALLTDLTRSILRAGFKRIVIVNGHGGNIAALNALNGEIAREIGAELAVTTYFSLAAAIAPSLLEDQRTIHHACEAETSMMMAAKPELVDHAHLAEAFGPIPADGQSPLSAPLNRWRSFTEITPSGVIGDARRSNPEKGEKLLEACAAALAQRLAKGEPWA